MPAEISSNNRRFIPRNQSSVFRWSFDTQKCSFLNSTSKNKMHQFSPIQDKEQLTEAVRYVATQTSRLAEKIIGMAFPIKSLTLFSHSQAEYEILIKILAGMGKPYNENNGPRVELHEPIAVGENRITHLRIRKSDQERLQVGCNDFETDYTSFKNTYLAKHPNNLRLVERPEYEMIEFYDKDFDVLAYIVSN